MKDKYIEEVIKKINRHNTYKRGGKKMVANVMIDYVVEHLYYKISFIYGIFKNGECKLDKCKIIMFRDDTLDIKELQKRILKENYAKTR